MQNDSTVGSMGYDISHGLPAGTSSSAGFQPSPTNSAYIPNTPVAPANITASSLATANPLIVPTPSTNSPASSIISDSAAQVAKAQQDYANLQAVTGNKAEKASNSMMDAVKSIFGQKSDVLSGQAASETAAGLDTQTKALADLNTEIANQNVSLRGEQDRIRGVTQSESQKSVDLGNLQDTYGRRLADLAIRQSAAQGNIKAIQDASDRKTALLLAPLNNALDYYTKFGQANIDNLSKKETAQLTYLQDSIKTQQANLKELEKSRATYIAEVSKNGGGHDTALIKSLQDAPNDQVMAAIASKYIGQNDLMELQSKLAVNKANIAQSYASANASNASAANSYASAAKTNQERKALVQDNNPNSDTQKTVISADAEDVLSGRNTLFNIRQTMGRSDKAAKYMLDLRNQIRSKDNTFDFVSSDAGGKFVSSTYFQRATASIDAVIPNVDKIVDLSNQVDRLGVKGVDSLLQKGAIQIGNEKVSNFHEAQKLIADEIGVALGAGTVSDMKLQLGFDVTDTSVKPEVFASNMKLVKEFILNRKAGLNQQRYSSPTNQTGGTTGNVQSSSDYRSKYGY